MAERDRLQLMADPKFHEGNRIGLEQLDRGQTVSYDALRRKYGRLADDKMKIPGGGGVAMAETTPEALKRLARNIRSEADAIEAGQKVRDGAIRDARPMDKDYQRGLMDGYRSSADLLDDGKG